MKMSSVQKNSGILIEQILSDPQKFTMAQMRGECMIQISLPCMSNFNSVVLKGKSLPMQ